MARARSQTRTSPLAKTERRFPAVRFSQRAAEAGLDFQHVAGDPREKNYILETTGSGVALIDYDGDGLLDVFFVNQARHIPAKPEGEPSNRLYRNRGGLRFEDVTDKAGLVRSGWGQGVCAGDYDNDGWIDLFVTYYGQNVLYRNRGDGSFEDVTSRAGLEQRETRWNTGCAFFDYDRDGRLDLAVANYIRFDPANTPKPGENELCRHEDLPVVCGPRGLPGGANLLYHNEGEGRFRDVTQASGFGEPAGYYGFSVLPGDFDDDGWVDIYIACDSTPSILLRNNQDGTFTDIGLESGVALNAHGQEQGGMGAALGDYNRDGRLDIVKTNFDHDVPSFYRNDGDGFFTDVVIEAGLAVHNRLVGWGVAFVDVDQDGWQDVFLVNGHVYPEVEQLGGASRFRQPPLLYWNLRNGAFLDVSAQAGLTQALSARGAAFGDIDNDGDIDGVVNNLNSAPSLLVNEGAKGNWLKLLLKGAESNRSALGARVLLTAEEASQTAEVHSGGSFLSQNDLRLHFGLGKAKQVEAVEVRWPNGEWERFRGGEVNRLLVIEEGKGAPGGRPDE